MVLKFVDFERRIKLKKPVYVHYKCTVLLGYGLLFLLIICVFISTALNAGSGFCFFLSNGHDFAKTMSANRVEFGNIFL